jgi:DNA processing protein
MIYQIIKKDKNYPSLLKKIGKQAPEQLYYRGEWSNDIFENCLAIVGSRRMTSYGRQIAEKIAGEVATAGITIVSGFMYGIDTTAHRAALSVGGKTIAVMPCGVDIIHPAYQQDLYTSILKNKGLILSEYKDGTNPAKWTYPQRNRIVAGLSETTLVVEAGEKSGSLITANWAKKFGRKIFVVPGPITSENNKGIMQLIKEGATPISSAQDIFSYYNVDYTKSLSFNIKEKTTNKKKGIEVKIIEQLQREAMDIDTMAKFLNIKTAELGTMLSLMHLKGKIKLIGNKYYVS